MKLAFMLIALNMLLTSCVSTTTLDKEKAALEACQEQAQKDVQSCQENITSLETDLNNAKQERDKYRKEFQQAQSSALEIEKRANELRHSLQKEILDRNVEIETLKGKLSVHVLDRILFKSGSAQILSEGKAVLNTLGNKK